MSITTIKNEEVLFIEFRGMGICLKVDGEKLVPIAADEDETTESLLNDFKDHISDFVETKKMELKKTDVVLPLVNFLSSVPEESGGMPPDISNKLVTSLSKATERCKESIGKAQELVFDITDLMMKYDVPIHPADADGEQGNLPLSRNAEQQLNDILAKISKKQ